MFSAILFCAMAQVHATVSLDPVPPCPTCDALSIRVAALEAQLQLASARAAQEPVRRVRFIEVSPPVRTVTYTAPLGAALPALSAWAPGSYVVPAPTYMSPGAVYGSTSFVGGRGLLGGRLFGSRFSATSVCGPGGCP